METSFQPRPIKASAPKKRRGRPPKKKRGRPRKVQSSNGAPSASTAIIECPFHAEIPEDAYISDRLQMLRLTRDQSRALKQLHLSLDLAGERLSDHRRIRTDVAGDAIRWLLEQLSNA